MVRQHTRHHTNCAAEIPGRVRQGSQGPLQTDPETDQYADYNSERVGQEGARSSARLRAVREHVRQKGLAQEAAAEHV